ncbi:hypothetical protein F4802DRAFT_327331 [Xylaria palmicola]|nr:hypothetical protein F4802DRAFT_327331 [Xylaria palmicola]
MGAGGARGTGTLPPGANDVSLLSLLSPLSPATETKLVTRWDRALDRARMVRLSLVATLINSCRLVSPARAGTMMGGGRWAVGGHERTQTVSSLHLLWEREGQVLRERGSELARSDTSPPRTKRRRGEGRTSTAAVKNCLPMQSINANCAAERP